MRACFPATIDEVLVHYEEDPSAVIWAGGTDLMVFLRAGHRQRPESVIFLEKVNGLKEIKDEGDYVHIGAAATHTAIRNDPLLRSVVPVLCRAVEVLGSPPVRNMGTIGGNLCTASPAGDTITPLFVLEAELELRRRHQTRKLSIREFFKGPGKTALEKGELLTGIRFKKPRNGSIQYFEKVGRRKALAIAIASMAALIETNPDGVIEKARFAWGSVAPTVVRFEEVDALFEGDKPSGTSIQKAAELVRQKISPIDDLRASAWYRRQVAGNLLFRLELLLSL